MAQKCRFPQGMSAGGGNEQTLEQGNLTVRGNKIHHIANWKRTYQAAISFSGSGNVYADNEVGFAPHTCMTGADTDRNVSKETLDPFMNVYVSVLSLS